MAITNTIATFDPTGEMEVLSILRDGVESQLTWSHTDNAAGQRLITELKKLHLTSTDELRIVAGPGSFSAIRAAALVANSVRLVTQVQLFSRQITETEYQPVAQVVPHYGTPPVITPRKQP